VVFYEGYRTRLGSEGGAPLGCCSRPEIMWSKNLLLPMTTGSICGKLFPESRKWPSPNSSFPTNAISVAARTSWLCRYSMSRAQGHIPVQVFGDRANPTQLEGRHRRAGRGMAAHSWSGVLVPTSSFSGVACFFVVFSRGPTILGQSQNGLRSC